MFHAAGNGDVDLTDLAVFDNDLGSSDASRPGGCEPVLVPPFKGNRDDDVELLDLGESQTSFTGYLDSCARPTRVFVFGFGAPAGRPA
jgi:hypothetical protein